MPFYSNSLLLKRKNIIFFACGKNKCSIDYFFTNFPSHLIEKIIMKNNEITNNKSNGITNNNKNGLIYCGKCSKFINDNNHEYK